MTGDQMNREVMYHSTMAPLRKLYEMGLITDEEYRAVDMIMCQKYVPVFCRRIAPESLDIGEDQR